MVMIVIQIKKAMHFTPLDTLQAQLPRHEKHQVDASEKNGHYASELSK